MGFQFNHVGGGTKTRRPIALHMKYNGACTEPHCFLVNDSGQDQEMSLEELREYIEHENQRLNAESRFQNKDITVKIHYKYCPNLTIVDTPGVCPCITAAHPVQCGDRWIAAPLMLACSVTPQRTLLQHRIPLCAQWVQVAVVLDDPTDHDPTLRLLASLTMEASHPLCPHRQPRQTAPALYWQHVPSTSQLPT